MTSDSSEIAALQEVRALERVRIDALRMNDADAMLRILGTKFIGINNGGTV